VSGSLFRRISRYGVSAGRDAREDRLTEICAALFASARCSGLPRHVALSWLTAAALQHDCACADELAAILGDEDRDWRCEVRTQLRIEVAGAIRRPDLELRFSHGEPDGRATSVVLWIEFKHGTTPHSGQLHAYVQAQRARRLAHATVLLVAPRADIPFDPVEIPAQVPVLSWQETARSLRAYPPPDDVARYLVDELCAYLKEEGLMDPDQLSPVHLVALANYREALSTLDRVCDIAAEEVSRRWNQGELPGRWPSTGPRSEKSARWWPYPSYPIGGSAPGVSDAWSWDWEQLDDSASVLLDGRPGVPCFSVGMAAEVKDGAMATLTDAQRAALEQAAFSLLALGDTNSRNYEYVWRIAYPEEVLAGRDLRSQGDALASWIHDGFLALSAALRATT